MSQPIGFRSTHCLAGDLQLTALNPRIMHRSGCRKLVIDPNHLTSFHCLRGGLSTSSMSFEPVLGPANSSNRGVLYLLAGVLPLPLMDRNVCRFLSGRSDERSNNKTHLWQEKQ